MSDEDFEKLYDQMADEGLLDPILRDSTTYKAIVLRGLKVGYQMSSGDEDRVGALRLVVRQLRHLFGFIPVRSLEKISVLNYEQVLNLALEIAEHKKEFDLAGWLAKNA